MFKLDSYERIVARRKRNQQIAIASIPVAIIVVFLVMVFLPSTPQPWETLLSEAPPEEIVATAKAMAEDSEDDPEEDLWEQWAQNYIYDPDLEHTPQERRAHILLAGAALICEFETQNCVLFEQIVRAAARFSRIEVCRFLSDLSFECCEEIIDQLYDEICPEWMDEFEEGDEWKDLQE